MTLTVMNSRVRYSQLRTCSRCGIAENTIIGRMDVGVFQ